MDKQARVTGNLGLARACAARFKGRGIEYEDLYQAACVGLVQAAERFDESRGLRFSTYAVPVILGEVKRLFREGGSVKVSRGLRELSRRARAQADAFAEQEGRAPTVGELAQLLHVEPEQAAQALGAAQTPLSLTSQEDGADLDLPDESQEELLTDRLCLREAMRELPARDRKLLYFRYFQSQTQTQIAQQLGMTQVQVSRREKKLLQTLRERLG